jgi:hypothetical protein
MIAINIIWKLLLAGFCNNHLHQIIYNPCTGGCYDGLEENYVNQSGSRVHSKLFNGKTNYGKGQRGNEKNKILIKNKSLVPTH